jgi:tripartite-type tricarboxylate transporter receptor subunit TctC
MARLVALALLLAGTTASVPALAQYPTKPVRIIPNSAAGTGPDVIARLLAARLTETLKQPVLVENRPGGNGNIAGDVVAHAAPDAHTLLVATDAQLAINPHVYSKQTFDWQKEILPVAPISLQAFELVIVPSIPARSVAEFIDYARKQNPPLFYGSAGNGSQHHLTMELFKQRTGVPMTHVPFAGGGSATATAMLANQVQATIGGTAVSVQVKGGKLRSLGTTSPRRMAPDLPTIAETLPGFEMMAWVGLFTTAGSPAEAVGRLRAETARFIAIKETVDKLDAAAFQPWTVSPEEFMAQVKRDYEKYGAVVKSVGVKLD